MQNRKKKFTHVKQTITKKGGGKVSFADHVESNLKHQETTEWIGLIPD